MSGPGPSARRLWVLALLALIIGAGFPYFEETRNANERPRLMQGMALVEGHTFSVSHESVRGLDPGPDTARNEEGELYPNKPPGTAPIAVAAYWAEKGEARVRAQRPTIRGFTFWARLFGGLVPTLVICALAMDRYRETDRGTTRAAIILYALASPAFSYAHLFYGHQLAAALLYAGIVYTADATALSRPLTGALGGLLAGFAVCVEYGAVFAAPAFALVLLRGVTKTEGIRTAAYGLAGAAVPIALLAAYHWAAYGSPLKTGYHNATNADFAEKHSVGLLGLSWPKWEGFSTHMLSQDGGLVWWCPLVVVALVGLGLQAASTEANAKRTEARMHLGVFVALVLVGSGLSFDGGWRVGPRYMVVTLPLLIPGLAEVWERMKGLPQYGRWGLGLGLAVLSGWSVGLNAMAANLWPHLDLTNIHSPAGEVLWPLLTEGYAPYSIFWVMGLSVGGYALVAMAVVTVGVAVVVPAWKTRPPDTMARALAIGGFVLGFALLPMVGRMTEPHEKGERNLAYIKRVYEPTRRSENARKSLSLPEAARKKNKLIEVPE